MTELLRAVGAGLEVSEGAAVLVFLAPFVAGGILQVLLAAFTRPMLPKMIPALFGLVGMAWSIAKFSEAVDMAAISLYWLVFFLWLILVGAVTAVVRDARRKAKKGKETGCTST